MIERAYTEGRDMGECPKVAVLMQDREIVAQGHAAIRQSTEDRTVTPERHPAL